MSFTKDPDAVLDYTVDWSDWLSDGETIATSEWLDVEGIVKDFDTNTDTTATVWLSGGTSPEVYVLTNRITTSDGRGDDRSIRIRVRDR